jgi:hypothetical protein
MKLGPLPRLKILDDRARLPWRFLARHITVDALSLAS